MDLLSSGSYSAAVGLGSGGGPFVGSVRRQVPLILLAILCAFRVARFCDSSLKVCAQRDHVLEIPGLLQKIDPHLQKVRDLATVRAQKYFPSPHSEILLGMVMGLDHFRKLPFFREMLVDTGTIHVVVVSGYNISLVYSFVYALLGSYYSKLKLGIGFGVAFLYAGLSGFGPPVVRSLVMGSIAYLGKHSGKKFPTLRLLLISVLVMVLWQPAFIFSVSFQLSLSATLSLVLFTGYVEEWFFLVRWLPEVFREDLASSIAVQILIWPLLSYYFGQISLVSLAVNTLVLWTVSMSTVLGAIFMVVFPLGEVVARICSFVVYIPLDIFVNLIKFFANLGISPLLIQLSFSQVVYYYVGLLGLYLFLRFGVPLFRPKIPIPRYNDVL
jgi:competence protein ComEC